MATLQELIAKKEELEEQINAQRAIETSDALQKVKELVSVFNFSESDVFGKVARRSVASARPASKVAAKYRDPVSGATWSGRGLAPKWLAGRNKDEFLIQS